MAVFGNILYCILILCMVMSVKADLFCDDVKIAGDWTFIMGPGGNNRTLKCDRFTAKSTYKMTLKLPNVAIDQNGAKGTWTMVANGGFEVTVAEKAYFGYFKWNDTDVFCNEVGGGWSHDIKDKDWACYNASKNSGLIVQPEPLRKDKKVLQTEFNPNSDDIVEAINNAGLSWTAIKYPQFEGLTKEDFIRMAGGKVRQIGSVPKPAPLTKEDVVAMETLPRSFDWRNVKGVNYVSPVRDQGYCGGCYAFSSLAMLEARVRIATKNKEKTTFSPQDVIDCNEYSDTCNGGWPYLVNKYAEDFGVVTEKCSPYTGDEHLKCVTNPKCARHYATNHTYIGGYYGACNEARMMKAVYENGPIVVGFWAYKDFFNYHSGIYHHKPDPNEQERRVSHDYEMVNHAVAVVGWGENKKGEKYWIAKNSWGRKWGMRGYFWIKKGTDNCAVESVASEAFPIHGTAHLN